MVGVGCGGGSVLFHNFFTHVPHDLSITIIGIMSCNHVEPLSAAGALLLAPSSLLHLSTHYRITHQHEHRINSQLHRIRFGLGIGLGCTRPAGLLRGCLLCQARLYTAASSAKLEIVS